LSDEAHLQMTTDGTDGLWHKEEMTLALKFERAWVDDKTLKFTDIYQEDFCGAGLKVRPDLVNLARMILQLEEEQNTLMRQVE
jgi:hypothetical protein